MTGQKKRLYTRAGIALFAVILAYCFRFVISQL